MLKSKKSRKT